MTKDDKYYRIYGYLTSYHIYALCVYRENQVFMTLLALALLPVWLLFFWILTLCSIAVEEPTYIEASTRYIVFTDPSQVSSLDLDKPGLVIIFTLSVCMVSYVASAIGLSSLPTAIWFGVFSSVVACLMDEDLIKTVIGYVLYIFCI